MDVEKLKKNLLKKSVSGVKWSFAETILAQFLRLAIGIVLARLLTPADYGLISIAVIFFTISDVFITSGLGQAFIQKKDANETDAHTIFSSNFLVSVLFYLLLWFGSPWIASFFDQPELTLLIRVMAVIVIINSFNVIQFAIIRKNLQFKKKTLYSTISYSVSGVTGILCAFNGLGVWSLVIQQVLNKLLLSILLFKASPYTMKFSFSYDAFKPLFAFGSWLLLTNIVMRAFDQLYKFVIGKYYTSDALGLFEKGQQFPKLIYQQLSWTVGTVAFPVYSKLQDDKEEMNNAVNRFLKYSLILNLPLLGILFVVSESFVLVLLTQKWAGIIPFLKLFCIIGIFFPFYSYMLQFLEANGRTKLVFSITILMVISRILNVWINLDKGIIHIITGELVIVILTALLTLIITNRITGLSVVNLVRNIYWIYFSSAVMVLTGTLFYRTIEPEKLSALLITTMIMMLVYSTLMYKEGKKIIVALIK